MNRNIKTIADEQAIDNMIVVKDAETLHKVNRPLTELYHYTYKKSLPLFRKDFNSMFDEYEDLHHDTWLKTLLNRKSYLARKNVFTWFYTILKNNSINLLNSSYKKTNIPLNDNSDSDGALVIVSDKNTPLTIISSYSNMDIDVLLYMSLIKDVVANHLSKQEQELFRLYFMEDKNTVEIAKVMNIGNATVDRLKKEIIKKLKENLN